MTQKNIDLAEYGDLLASIKLVQQPVALIKRAQQLAGQIRWGHNVLIVS